MQFQTVEELEHDAMADHDEGTELAAGVVMHRRAILRFGWSAAGLAALGNRSLAGHDEAVASAPPAKSGRMARKELSLSALVAELHPQSRELIEAVLPDESAYLAAVRRLLVRIKPDPVWSLRSAGKDWSMDTSCWMPPLAILTIRMEPGASMQLHDHRHYNGVLLCTSGTVQCRNFEFVPDAEHPLEIVAGQVPPEGSDFLIRQTREELLKPRAMSTLTRDQDNLHTIVAGDKGCELIDFFTYFRPEARSYELDWDETPVNASARTFRASWRKEQA